MTNGRYAARTQVAPDQSLAEIRRTLSRFGASGFGFLEEDRRAVVMFSMAGLHIRFILPLPSKSEFRYTPARRFTRTPEQMEAAWREGCAERWRALALTIKSKVVSVETGIETFEQSFMAHIVAPGDERTVGEIVLPQVQAQRESMEYGPLRLAPPSPASQPLVARIEPAEE